MRLFHQTRSPKERGVQDVNYSMVAIKVFYMYLTLERLTDLEFTGYSFTGYLHVCTCNYLSCKHQITVINLLLLITNFEAIRQSSLN